MDIYDSNGNKLEYSAVLANLPITESCEHVEELMKADHIVLSWHDSEKYTLPVGAYITYKGVNYALLEPYEPEQKSGDEFEYTPNFQHPKMYLGKVPFRFPTTDTEGNSITLLEWPYSGDIDTLLTFFCRTMESELGLTANTFNYSILGEIDMVVSTTFNAVDILSALSNIANQLKCEWHIDWDYKVLYFGHIELSRDEVDETVLEVGVNVGTPSVRSSKEGFYNTYEPQGSTRNISKRAASGEYVQGDVRLALNEEDYPDKVIYTDESGTVIASLPQGVKKYVKPLIYDNIYPKLDLYVYDVRCRERYLLDDNGEKIIDHYDSHGQPVYKRYAVWYMRLAYPTKVDGHVTAWTDYTINPETDIISGKNLGGAFQPNTYSGAESFPLAGRGNADDGGYGFELNYHTTAETIPANPNDGDTGVIIKAGDYEIVFQQQNDYILPTTASQGIIPKGVKVNGQEVTDLNGLTNLDDGQKGNIVDLYNIVIGSAYTKSAQDELANETLKYIANQFKDNNSYTLKSDVVAFKKQIDQDELLHTDSSLYIGKRVTYKNGDYELETRVMKLITKLDYAFVQEITVGNEVLKGSTTTLKEQVQTILSGGGGNGSGGVDSGAVRKIVQAYTNPRFLSKINDDTAQGFITMLKGLQIGANFDASILGEGGVLRMNNDGKVELVVDTIYARMRAYFDSVVVREYKHESGNRIVSPAQGFNAARIEWIQLVEEEIEGETEGETITVTREVILEQTDDNKSLVDFFRCYWRVDDGEKKTENQFIIGDLAFCEHADVTNGSLITKRYWRVVVGRNAGNTTTEDGEAWIDLSNAHDANGAPMMTTISWEGQGGVTQTLSVKSFESSTNGIPEAHDDICMLGCTTDTTRQGAIIEYVSGTDAPTYQIYQGLGSDTTNPYVLTNKNQISFGYNSSTGKAYMNVYGDAYIGDRNRNTFLEYKQNGAGGNPELNIKAKVQILPNGSTINGQSIPDYIKDNQNNYDDTKVKADIAILDATTQDLQKQIDGAIETWFMTGVPTLQNAPANEWTTDDEKDKHIGDLYYDKATGHGYRFMYDDENEVYLWTLLTDEDVTEALRIASEAQETADGKRTIYSVWGAWMKNNVNTLEVGDLFIPAANTTQGGVTYKANKVYKCTTDGSATFQAADYIDAAQAQAKIDAFVSNTYNPDKINLQSQIDGKAETFRQATDPSLDWYVEEGGEVTLDVRANHVGDLWMDISANGGNKTYIYEDNGESADPRYEWKAQEVPDEVFDEIDGKSTIFGNAIATPPTDYKKDDMWLLPAAATINGTAYKKGDVLSASQDSTTYSAAHWSKKIRYTDDSAFNGYISAFLSGSGASGDSATAAAIQRAITSALGSALGSATLIDGGLMLTSLIGMRQLNDEGDPSQISDYTTWAGISGQYVARDAADPQDPTVPWAKGHGIAAWYGGDMVDKEMLTQAQIDAGWGTGEGQYRWAKSVDRFDGSGYRANGNITWNANGELAISDITSIQPSGSNTNVLNDMIQFSNAFHFNTVQGGSTILNIVPQYPFYSLYLYDTSQPNNRSHVASQKWVDDHYVSKTFFRQLFRAFKPNETAGQADVEVQPNTIDATISNIKAMVGFWTEQYVSALGNNSDGGGGGASVLYGLNDVTPNATGDGVMGAQDGYVLTYNGSTHHWYAAATAETYVLPQATAVALGGIKIGYTTSGKNYAIALDTNGKAYVNVPWTDTTYTLAGLMGSTAIGGATQPIYWDGSAFKKTTYTLAKSVPADAKFTDTTYSFSNADATLAWSTRTKIATTGGTDIYVTMPANPNTNTWRNVYLDGTSKVGTATDTKALNFLAGSNIDIIYTAAGTGEDESGSADYFNIEIKAKNVYDSSTSRTKNTVLAAPNGSNGAATFRALVAADIPSLAASKITSGTFDTARIPTLAISKISGLQDALDSKLDKSFFHNLFRAHKTVSGVDTVISANGDLTDAESVEAMFGFWTEQFISSLGQGSDGGGGGQGDVTWDLLASSSDTRQIALSHLTTALSGYSPTSHTHTTTIAADSGTNQLTLAYGTKYKITAGGTSFVFTMPSADDTNTWRNIYVAGTQQITTAVNTKGLNFAAGNNVSLSFAAAGTGSGQSGNANYGTITISATDTTYSNATQSAAGLMSAADKKKLDGIAANANNYSLPLAASGVRGGVQIGFTTDGANRNYAVQLSSEKAYVNVPWENTWRGIQNNLTSDSTTDSLSAAQGKALKGSITTLEGYFTSGIANQAACLRYGSSITTQEELDSYLDANKLKCCIWKDFTPTGLYGNGIVIAGSWANTSYGFQLAIDDDPTYKIHLRQRNGDGWKNWKQIPMGDGTGASGTWGISITGSSASCTGNAATATKLQTSRTINGTSFDGSANITTANWGTARNISIADSDSTNTGSAVSVNGSAAVTLKLPSTIKATLSGNASSASKLTTVSKTAWGQTFWTSGGVPTSISGALSSVTNITMSGYIKIGDAYLSYDSTNNAIRVSANADGTGVVNFYAIGGVSALGQGEDGGGGGQGDVTWALLEKTATGGRTIHSSYISGTLANYLPKTGGTLTGALTINPSNVSSFQDGIILNDKGTGGSEALTIKWTSATYTTGNKLTADLGYNRLIFHNGTSWYNVLTSGDSSVSKSGETLTVKINGVSQSLTNSTYTLAGLMGSSAKGSTTQPIYWTGSAFANTSYTLGKSVPSDAKFTDTTYSASTGLNLSGTAFSVSYAPKVLGSYTQNGGQQNPNYFGVNRVGFLMMNTTVNGNSHYKDWVIMDCYGGNDAGGGVAIGVNRQSLGAYIMRSAAARTSWEEKAELCGTHNSSVSLSGSTLTVKIAGVEKSLTNTNTTYSAGKGLRLSGTQFISDAPRVAKDSKVFGGQNTWIMEEYNQGANYNLPTSNKWYHIMSTQGSDTNYGTQLALCMEEDGVYFRHYKNRNWGEWKSLINTDTTYSAGTGISLSGTTFSNSGVRAATINGNYLRVNTNGTNADLTIPYATKAAQDNDGTAFKGNYLRKVLVANNTTNDFNTFENMTLTGRGDPTTGASLSHAPWSGAGPAGGYGVLTYLWSSYGIQMAWGYYNNHIYIRNKNYSSGVVWSDSWSTVALTSDIPTKVSQLTNDSGYITSSASITGNAATATNADKLDGYHATSFMSFTDNTNYVDCNFVDGNLAAKAVSKFVEFYQGGWFNFKIGTLTCNSGLSVSANAYLCTSSGNVGIGTTSPSYKLSVNGNFGSISTNSSMIFSGSGDGLMMHTTQNTSSYYLLYLSYAESTLGTINKQALVVRANGNVGIGLSQPSYKLHVDGDVYATGGVTCLASTSSSDIRLKDVQGNVNLNVEQVADAPAVRFLWKKDHSLGMQAGSIAQYWQKVLPETIKEDREGFLSMNYGVAALLSTIVVAKKVVNHEQRIKELEEECERLRTELSQYKTI